MKLQIPVHGEPDDGDGDNNHSAIGYQSKPHPEPVNTAITIQYTHQPDRRSPITSFHCLVFNTITNIIRISLIPTKEK